MAAMALEENGNANATSDAVMQDTNKHKQTNSTCTGNQAPERTVEVILKDMRLGGDMMWSIFVSAAKSYRFSSILHPFPPMFIGEQGSEKLVTELREAVSKVPKFSSSLQFLNEISPDSRQLLSWVFQKPKFYLQVQHKKECFTHIRSLTGQIVDAPEPSFVFEVVYDSQEEAKFKARLGQRKNIFAYHGTRFDNFYSILHNGLNGHLNKVAAFGEGTYLSSELSVSLLYSQAGEAWSKSCIGAKLACVAVCEMIDEPSVKCQIKEGNASAQKQRAQASRMTDAVPEKYYVVQNNDAVRVKYLLVYKDQSISAGSTGTSIAQSWFQQHKFPLLMLAYVVLLVAIGLANSRQTAKTFNWLCSLFQFS